MNFELPSLPYSEQALEPHLSARTLNIHHGKHHGGYLSKLAEVIDGTELGDEPLETVIRKSEGSLRNWASQVYNHELYWHSLSPEGGGEPEGELLEAVRASFGSADALRKELAEAANGEFGSGWAWLVARTDGRLAVTATTDAESPVTAGSEDHPLLTIDVWEHAYYLDFQHERDAYLQAVLDHLIHWKGAEARLRNRLARGAGVSG